jgi:hypothetical protein
LYLALWAASQICISEGCSSIENQTTDIEAGGESRKCPWVLRKKV